MDCPHVPKCTSLPHCDEHTRADRLLEELLPLKRVARDAIAMYDRYCADDQAIDLFDIGCELEKLRKLVTP